MSVNKVILIGNVGKDPDVRHLESGVIKAAFSLATSESFKNKEGNWEQKTEWHNIVTWRQTAEYADKYIKKGLQIYVEGKIANRQYDDKDGNKRYICEIVADTIRLLGKKESSPLSENPNNNDSKEMEKQPAKENISPVSDDDLPF